MKKQYSQPVTQQSIAQLTSFLCASVVPPAGNVNNFAQQYLEGN